MRATAALLSLLMTSCQLAGNAVLPARRSCAGGRPGRVFAEDVHAASIADAKRRPWDPMLPRIAVTDLIQAAA